MSDTFTLLGNARLQQEIRKSRFLAQAMPVASAEIALAFVAQVGMTEATHHCWAYRIGSTYRFSDDGEPGGSAGKPILMAIDGQQMDRVVVVVSRWYGGVKLGVGGLARAYGGCASECLRQAERMLLVERIHVRVRCDFSTAPLIYSRLADFTAVRTAERSSADGVEIDLDVPVSRVDDIAGYVREVTRGRGMVVATP
ncbi:MAG: YigZ family protein [Dokdonella sp.]|uniref:IMPACT family protein n=1 Tax=Dokdonella sp. TaxID=2291710 RepID=UPI0032668B8D